MLVAPCWLLVVVYVGSSVDVQGSTVALHFVAQADVVVVRAVSPVLHGSTAIERNPEQFFQVFLGQCCAG